MRSNEMTQLQRRAVVARAEKARGLSQTYDEMSGKVRVLDTSDLVPIGGGEFNRHPSGMLVHGPGAAEAIAAANRKGSGASSLFAVIAAYVRAYLEPPLRLYRGPRHDFDSSEQVESHALVEFLNAPNPYLTTNQLRAFVRWSLLYAGNGYLGIQRFGGGTLSDNTTGAVAALWPMPTVRMTPKKLKSGGNGWIDYYAYDVGGPRPVMIPPENVMHFRLFVDPADPRVGVKTVDEIAREVAMEAESAKLYEAVLTNLGVPGLVFSPKSVAGETAGIPKDERLEIRDSLDAKTGAGNRGRPIVLSRPADLQTFSTDLDKLNLSAVWRHVETRISGAIGWPAILAGLEAGLDSATLSNARTLREYVTESTLLNAWHDDGETFTQCLGHEFGLKPDEWIGHDIRRVRALQEDTDSLWKRIGMAWARNEITLEQHHDRLGLDLPPGADPNARAADLKAPSMNGLLGMSRSFPTIDVESREHKQLVDHEQHKEQGWVPPGNEQPLTDDELEAETQIDERFLNYVQRYYEALFAETDPEFAHILTTHVEDDEEKQRKAKAPVSWVWDAETQRYRWPNTGKAVPPKRVAQLRDRMLKDMVREVEQLADDLADGRISLRQWQRQMANSIKRTNGGTRMLASGGRQQMTFSDWGKLGAKCKKEYKYLRRFADDIHEGRLTPAQVKQRARLYAGSAPRGSYAEARQDRHVKAGYDRKRRMIQSANPCETCLNEAGEGWVPMDTAGWELGNTICDGNDGCEIEFGKSKNVD